MTALNWSVIATYIKAGVTVTLLIRGIQEQRMSKSHVGLCSIFHNPMSLDCFCIRAVTER